MPPRTPAGRASIAFSSQSSETQLSQSAYLQLENLKKSDTASQQGNLQQTLNRAADLIQKITATLNDRAADERTRRQERQAKLRRDGNEESEEVKERHENFQQEVETLTKKMDDQIRAIVDQQHWVEGVPAAVNHIIDKSKEVQSRARRRTHNEDEELDDDDAQTQTSIQPNAHETASALLHAAQTTSQAEWSSKSLTDRYSRNPTYTQFYEIVWDAQNPGEHRPPMPHHSHWFAAQEGRNTTATGSRGTQRSVTQSQDQANGDADNDIAMQDLNDNEEDTELEIATTMRSTKCPLTMMYFQEPVTSTKCPHSFEKSAVLQFIRSSGQRMPLTAAQIEELDARTPRSDRARAQAETNMRNRNPKHAQCPEAGCTVWLTENDLRADPVLARITARAKEAERREREENEGQDLDDELGEDDSDDGLPRGTQRKRKKITTLTSSPTGTGDAEARRRTLIKNERDISVVPNSQGPSQRRRRGNIADVDDDDDDE